jgi:hypothetical protein
LFVSGNDAGAKAKVRELLQAFGWNDVMDLGDIATARATEGYLPPADLSSIAAFVTINRCFDGVRKGHRPKPIRG